MKKNNEKVNESIMNNEEEMTKKSNGSCFKYNSIYSKICFISNNII